MVRLVVDNSDEELAFARALRRVDRALVRLAANILRVTRGAGKPQDLGNQAIAFIEALEAHRDETGRYPYSDELAASLRLEHPSELTGHVPDYEVHRAYALRQLVRGALQVVASQLLAQRTQRAAGEGELYEGVRGLEEAREAGLAAWRVHQRKGFTEMTRRPRPTEKAKRAKPPSPPGKPR